MASVGAERHRSRERAFQLLYEGEIKQRGPAAVLTELEVRPDDYVIRLLSAVAEHREWAETLLSEHLVEWPLDRLAVVDRLVMILALCELRLDDAPPKAVVLDEAVEMARTYSTDASPGFVNGVLAACVDDPVAWG